jgi:uncharacterized protein YabN with tetrapyrrole methylase and pyrophosphatase domain
VVENNLEKMVRRHPHVFGDVTAKTLKKSVKTGKKLSSKKRALPGERQC